MSLGDNIKNIRIQKGLTQKQLADSCGLADATIRTYELGKSNPKTKTVTKIAKALGVSAAELYGVDWVPGIESQSEEINSVIYQSLSSGREGALSIPDPNKTRLMVAFDKLNQTGQAEAIKRIEELAQLPAYLRLTSDAIIVGKKIRHIRNEKNLTYQQLAALSKIPVETLQQIEFGIMLPDFLRPLSTALGVTLFDLLNFTSEEQEEINKNQGFCHACEEMNIDHSSDLYKELTQRARAKLVEIVDTAAERLQMPEQSVK